MDTLFFIVSKVVGLFLRGETWIVLLLGIGALAHYRGRLRSARLWFGAGFLLLIVITTTPVANMMLRPFETAFPVTPELQRVDGIIVLGGAEQAGLAGHWGLPLVNEAGERFLQGAALAHRFPNAALVFTGGSGALSDLGRTTIPQADMALGLFTSLGISSDRIKLEGTSRNTAENARNTMAFINPAPDEVWVLVTSAFHMRRAYRSFQTAGWHNIIAWPVDHRTVTWRHGWGWNLPRNLRLFNAATKETVGLIAYWLTGR